MKALTASYTLRILVAYNKVSNPATTHTFIKLNLDTVQLQIRLPRGELIDIMPEIHYERTHHKTTKSQLHLYSPLLALSSKQCLLVIFSSEDESVATTLLHPHWASSTYTGLVYRPIERVEEKGDN